MKVKSIGLSTFTDDEVRALLAQHTEETGQPFEEPAIARIVELAGGHARAAVLLVAVEVFRERHVVGPQDADGGGDWCGDR